MKKLKEFLEEAKVHRHCSVCSDIAVSRVIEEHLDLLRDGETVISLRYVHEHFILANYPTAPKTMDTIRKHVRKCLKRDPKTGEELTHG